MENTEEVKDKMESSNVAPLSENPTNKKKYINIPSCPNLKIPYPYINVLKPHQLEGISFLWKKIIQEKIPGCILAHAMGLGKTLQVVLFIESILKLQPKRFKHILILTPKIVVGNWKSEFKKWCKYYRTPSKVYALGKYNFFF